MPGTRTAPTFASTIYIVPHVNIIPKMNDFFNFQNNFDTWHNIRDMGAKVGVISISLWKKPSVV